MEDLGSGSLELEAIVTQPEYARVYSEDDLKDPNVWRKALAWSFSWYSQTQRRLDAFKEELEGVIRIMTYHKIHEHQGRTLECLKAQLKHRGRTFVDRGLITHMGDRWHDSHGYPVGLDLEWGFPGVRSPSFKFVLESENGLRRLEATIDGQTEREDKLTYLKDDELRVRFEVGSGIMRTFSVSYRRRAKTFDKWEYASMPQEGSWGDAMYSVFKQQGFLGAWKLLDKIWLDISSSRPMNQALSNVNLEARHWLLFGHDVKVFTPRQAFAGTWQHTFADTSGKLSGVRIQLARSGKTIEIPGDQIYELLPCRLEMEQ